MVAQSMNGGALHGHPRQAPLPKAVPCDRRMGGAILEWSRLVVLECQARLSLNRHGCEAQRSWPFASRAGRCQRKGDPLACPWAAGTGRCRTSRILFGWPVPGSGPLIAGRAQSAVGHRRFGTDLTSWSEALYHHSATSPSRDARNAVDKTSAIARVQDSDPWRLLIDDVVGRINTCKAGNSCPARCVSARCCCGPGTGKNGAGAASSSMVFRPARSSGKTYRTFDVTAGDNRIKRCWKIPLSWPSGR